MKKLLLFAALLPHLAQAAVFCGRLDRRGFLIDHDDAGELRAISLDGARWSPVVHWPTEPDSCICISGTVGEAHGDAAFVLIETVLRRTPAACQGDGL